MPMNHKERQIIEYRPRLGLKINIRALLESIGEDPEQVYEAPDELIEATQNLASDTLDKALAVMDELKKLVDELKQALMDDVADGIPFSDYLKARENTDDAEAIATARAWEDWHTNNPDGKIEGELYPLLEDARDKLSNVMDFLNREIFGGAEFDDIEEVKEKEINELLELIRKDIKEGLDDYTLASLKSRTELVQALDGAVSAIEEFVGLANELYDMNVDDAFDGHVESAIQDLATAGDSMLESIEELIDITFAEEASKSEIMKDQIERLSGRASQDLLFEEMKRLREMKLKAHRAFRWMDSVDTDFDDRPIARLIENSLPSLEAILDGYDDVLCDLHKANILASQQYNDLADILRNKERARSHRKVVKGMREHFNGNVNVFVTNMGFKKRKRRG